MTSMRLPFERETSINMHVFVYLYPPSFRIVQYYPWTTRVCVDWVRFPVCCALDPMRNFVSASPGVLRVHILSAYCRDVYQENNGDVLPKFCVTFGAEHGKTNPIYTYSGGIRTYLYLLACRLPGRNKNGEPD